MSDYRDAMVSAARSDVTVLVPAYRSAAFLPRTLDSVRRQTYRQFTVEIALEPDGAEETLAACREFLDDGRFTFRVNPSPLGWPGNVRWLLTRVQTPFYVFLPHDDGWHPTFLDTLVAALQDREDAVVAYCDRFFYGSRRGRRFSAPLPDAPRYERMEAFFLGGAEQYPWVGLTRSRVIPDVMTTNPFVGFAADCQYAFELVKLGVILHVKMPLYIKRARIDPSSVTADFRSGAREHQHLTLATHRQLLLRAIPKDLDAEQRRTLELAVEAAMLRRRVSFDAKTALTPEESERVAEVVAECSSGSIAVGPKILARIQLALSKVLMGSDQFHAGMDMLQQSVASDPHYGEAVLIQARIELRRGRPMESLLLALRAAELLPMEIGLDELQSQLAEELATRFAYGESN